MSSSDGDNNSFRYERKFNLGSISSFQAESLVKANPALFSECYPGRNINNIYLDSIDAMAYTDNVEGLSKRTKIRVRWYGDLFAHVARPVLELKIKEGSVGEKKRCVLSPFSVDGEIYNTIQERLQGVQGLTPDELQSIEQSRPVIMNRYFRKYYLSADGDFRLTLDYKLQFFAINRFENLFLRSSKCDDVIMELKYDTVMDDKIHEITAHLGHRLTKSSKYVTGYRYVVGEGVMEI
ncbi:MAG: polyphosphate polymerase domain-containing protein [Magnetococcales bacterium]|nr:polyphosphate polymerase domain-containing protein [Magnetococcales bacterium]